MNQIPCPIRTHARTTPDRPAISDVDKTISYGDLDRRISHIAARLKDAGIGPGDIVAALGFNSLQYAVLFYVSFRAGYTLMPLNCRLTESDWLSHLKAGNAGLCVVDHDHDAYSASLTVPTMRMNDLPPDRNFPADAEPDDDVTCSLSADALIIFSSGSVGAARGVVLTRSNVFHSASGAVERLQIGPDDVWLAALPFYHIGGISILFRTALAGCSTHVMPRFDADEVIGVVKAKDRVYLSLVPAMLRDLLGIDHDNILAECEAIILGGAGWDESLRQECAARRLRILTTYGLTETSSMVTLLPPGSSPEKTATAGTALAHREVKIIDDNRRALSVGEAGRIAVRGPVCFSRYLNRSNSPAASDGWFVTDDLGKLDRNGFLTVIGRADSVIVSGGENIDLNRIESELSSVPGVAGAVVMARRDERWGHRPVAFVEVSGDAHTESSIAAALAERLPKIMIPDRIIVLEQLPTTGSGKYDRQALRNTYRDLFQTGD